MRAAKVDVNQAEIVAALRKVGASVQLLHAVGRGCPDLLVGFRGKNFLLEVKRDGKAKLTPQQVEWHDEWRGQVAVVTDAEHAVKIVIGICK